MSFIDVTLQLWEGFQTTLLIFFVTLILALPLGLIIAFGSMSKFRPIKWLTKTFVWIIRGTPLMLQLMVVFYGSSWIFHINIGRVTAVLIGFVINYAAYFSEIYRGGIESISRGQYEACQVLGMTKAEAFFKVVLMQVVKRIVPPMSNEIITLVKDTSLAQIVSVAELFFRAGEIVGDKFIVWPLFYIGVFYLLFCGVLTVLFGYIEKKMNYYRG